LSTDNQKKPTPALSLSASIDATKAAEWFRATFGDMPAPTADMDPRDEACHRDRRREVLAALERTIPPVYGWARFGAPQFAERVSGLEESAIARKIWRHPRLIFMGASRGGKTSLAVASLRRRAVESGKAAGFFHAYRLGVARIQHLAGHGEPEIVAHAMKLPLALLDDLGSERDTAANALPDVIFERHAEDRPLWVTTGLTRPQLVTRYGAGIVGRLFERSAVIHMGAASASSDSAS
jgi:hypothetical protein